MNNALKIPYYNENDSFDGAAVAQIGNSAKALLFHTEDAIYVRMKTAKSNGRLLFSLVPFPQKDSRCLCFEFTPSGALDITFEGNAIPDTDLSQFKVLKSQAQKATSAEHFFDAKIPYKFMRAVSGVSLPFSEGHEIFANFCELTENGNAFWNGDNADAFGKIYIDYETKETPEFSTKVNLRKYEEKIKEFEARPTEKGKILCYGSSNFTRWKKEKWGNPDIEEEIRANDGSKIMLNHGFGGCTAEELLYYYPRAVRPYEPRAIVICIGWNDRTFGYTNKEIMAYIAKIFDYARADFENIRFALCDMRPLYKGVGNKPEYFESIYEFNGMCKEYCEQHSDCILIEHSSSPMFFEDGCQGDYSKVKGDIYIEDKVHMTPEGYRQYSEFFKESIKDLL